MIDKGSASLHRNSISFERSFHLKDRNLNMKLLFGLHVFHEVSPKHLSELGFQIASGYILILPSRFNDGLNTDNSLSLHFSFFCVAVLYMPVSS